MPTFSKPRRWGPAKTAEAAMQFPDQPPVAVTFRQKGALGYTFRDFGRGAEVVAIKPGSQAATLGKVVVGR